MARYDQMYFHALDFLKGWPNEYALDFSARFSADMEKTDMSGGCVAHLDADGEFMPGAKGTQVPIFMINGPNDLDVDNDGGDEWTAIAPRGEASGLVGIDAFELETTEFETSQTYAPNDILHSPTEDQVTNGSENDAGKLYKRKGWTGGGNGALTLNTDSVCGIVSRGKRTNAHGRTVLAFWTFFHPSASA